MHQTPRLPTSKGDFTKEISNPAPRHRGTKGGRGLAPNLVGTESANRGGGALHAFTHIAMYARPATLSGANQTMGRATCSLSSSAAETLLNYTRRTLQTTHTMQQATPYVSDQHPCGYQPAEITQLRDCESTETSQQSSIRPLASMVFTPT